MATRKKTLKPTVKKPVSRKKDPQMDIEEEIKSQPSAPDYIRCACDAVVKIEDLKPNPKNPNLHPQAQIERFKDILKYTGVRKPIVVSTRSGLMVTGHGTLMAMEMNGMDLVPVDFQHFDSEEQEYAHMVADNGLQEWSELDRGILNDNLKDLGPDLDMAMFGLQNFKLDLNEDRPNQEETDKDWEDPKQSESVKKIVLAYSLDRYTEMMKNLMALGLHMNIDNLSDLVSSIVEGAMLSNHLGNYKGKTILKNSLKDEAH